MSDFVLVGGERYLRLDVVARWYRVEVAFLEEAVALELLEYERRCTGQLLSCGVEKPEHRVARHYQGGRDKHSVQSLPEASQLPTHPSTAKPKGQREEAQARLGTSAPERRGGV